MRKVLPLEQVPEKLQAWCHELGFQVEAAFEPSGDEELYPNRIVLSGRDAEWLGANRGQAMDALQNLLHEHQGPREEKQAYLDVNGARLFRMKEVVAMARLAVQKARSQGGYTFGPMSPRERRWLHLTIAKEAPDLTTESEGTGTFKPVKVHAKA